MYSFLSHRFYYDAPNIVIDTTVCVSYKTLHDNPKIYYFRSNELIPDYIDSSLIFAFVSINDIEMDTRTFYGEMIIDF